MYTVSIRNAGGDPSDLQAFATLDEARAFAAQERSRSADEPDAKRCGWEWTISDDAGGCWHTEELTRETGYGDVSWAK